MKDLKKLVPIIFTTLFFLSCSGDFEGYGDDSPEISAEVKSLNLSFTEGTITVNQEVIFQVLSDLNNDITSLCKIFVNDIEISGNKFIPDKVGEYSVYVTYNTLKSEIKKFTVITSTSSEVKDFKINILIEDITGAWCKHCPRVSYKLEQLKKQTDQVVVVAAHYGDALQFAKVSEMSNLFGLTGYPWAQVNRTNRWNESASAITSLLNDKAKAGVAIESSVSGNTLSVNFKAKFAEDFSDLKYLIKGLRLLQNSFGTNKVVHKKEIQIRKWARRSIVTIRDIKKGDVFSLENIWSKRPGTGIPSKLLPKVLNKKSKKNIKANKLLKLSDFK